MKKLLTTSLAIMAFTLAACDSKAPSDDVASKSVMKQAQRDVTWLSDVEIVDFKRANGWNDQSNPNQYDVRYDYNLRLTKPLAQAVLDHAKAIEQARKDNADEVHRQGATAEFLHSIDNLPDNNRANEWWASQGDNAKPRLAALIKDCAECHQYISDENHVFPFVLSWMDYEQVQYPDAAQTGAKTGRQAWVGFTKTEQGWMPVNAVSPGGDS